MSFNLNFINQMNNNIQNYEDLGLDTASNEDIDDEGLYEIVDETDSFDIVSEQYAKETDKKEESKADAKDTTLSFENNNAKGKGNKGNNSQNNNKNQQTSKSDESFKDLGLAEYSKQNAEKNDKINSSVKELQRMAEEQKAKEEKKKAEKQNKATKNTTKKKSESKPSTPSQSQEAKETANTENKKQEQTTPVTAPTPQPTPVNQNKQAVQPNKYKQTFHFDMDDTEPTGTDKINETKVKAEEQAQPVTPPISQPTPQTQPIQATPSNIESKPKKETEGKSPESDNKENVIVNEQPTPITQSTPQPQTQPISSENEQESEYQNNQSSSVSQAEGTAYTQKMKEPEGEVNTKVVSILNPQELLASDENEIDEDADSKPIKDKQKIKELPPIVVKLISFVVLLGVIVLIPMMMSGGEKANKNTTATTSATTTEFYLDINNTEETTIGGSTRFNTLEDLTLYISSNQGVILSNEKQAVNKYYNGAISKEELISTLNTNIEASNQLYQLLILNKSVYENEGKIEEYNSLYTNMENVLSYGITEKSKVQ